MFGESIERAPDGCAPRLGAAGAGTLPPSRVSSHRRAGTTDPEVAGRLGLSSPAAGGAELDQGIALALASGARGARLVAGGFGGFVLALVEATGTAELVRDDAGAAYAGRTGAGLVCRASGGAAPGSPSRLRR